MKENQEILPLTGLRFIAAFYIFLFHWHIRWPLTDNYFAKNMLDQGAIGMSLFFMLSGFVLALCYANESINYKRYFINRFARIYPIYVIAAVVTLPWIGITFGSYSLVDVILGLVRGTFLVFTNILLIQAWFPQLFNLWNDGGSWAISVEVFFYLMLPLILTRQLTQSSKRRLCVVASICFLLAILPGVSAFLFTGPANGIFYSVPVFRLPEFIIGICLCLAIRDTAERSKSRTILQIFVPVFFVTYLGFCGPLMPIYVGHNWIALPVIAFMIFSLSNEKGPITAVLSTSTFVWLGKISYCFYSFQALLILFLISKHDGVVHAIPYLSNNKFLAAFSLILLVAISALGYYVIEVPARRAIKAYFHGNDFTLSTPSMADEELKILGESKQ